MKVVHLFANQRRRTVDDAGQARAGAEPIVAMANPAEIVVLGFLAAVVNGIWTTSDTGIVLDRSQNRAELGCIEEAGKTDEPIAVIGVDLLWREGLGVGRWSSSVCMPGFHRLYLFSTRRENGLTSRSQEKIQRCPHNFESTARSPSSA